MPKVVQGAVVVFGVGHRSRHVQGVGDGGIAKGAIAQFGQVMADPLAWI